MPISFSQSALIASASQTWTLASLLKDTSAGPQYLVLSGLDRERYPSASSGQSGWIEGQGQKAFFVSPPASDLGAFSIVFTQTPQGYFNPSYGYLADLHFTASAQAMRSAYLSLSDLGGNYYGSLNIVTRDYVDPTPGAATPQEIAAVAQSYVGMPWNDNGCWVLATNIAASSGATLPLSTNQARIELQAPQSNGEWIVAYDSSKASAAERAVWQAQLRVGDILVSNNSCGGHISTVVAGQGYDARFIDNSGAPVPTGGAHDIVIEGAHSVPAFALSPDPDNVVIYRLDTTQILALSGLVGSGQVAPLFTLQGRTAVAYQVYDTANGSFSAGSAHSAASALNLSAATMSTLGYTAGGSGAIMLRAFNGSYWGDWQSVAVTAGSGPQPLVLHAPANAVYVHGGQSLTLASLLDTMPAAATSYSLDYSNGKHLEVSAAEFAKLTYAASIYTSADTISITAHSNSALASVPVQVTIATRGPSTQGIEHFVSLGATLPLSALFYVSLADNVPITDYGISTIGVQVIDWQGQHPSSGGRLQLNGAKDLLADAGVPPGNNLISAAELDKVTVVTANNTGLQFLQVWSNDGGSGSPGTIAIHTVEQGAPLLALPGSVLGGESLGFAALFKVQPGSAAPLYYRIIDPQGGGSLVLDASATNLQNKNNLTPGLFVLAAKDLAALNYIGALAGGSEQLYVSTSSDQVHWDGEVVLSVASRAVQQRAALVGGSGIDSYTVDGARAHFAVSQTAAGWSVRDLDGLQATQVLQNIERIQFSDGALALDIDGHAGQIYRLYQAAFDRVPDQAGLGFWLGQRDHGADMLQIAQAFTESQEFTAMAGATDAAFVESLYQHVLHRAPDSAGLAYWSAALAHGGSRADLLAAFADSPENQAQLIGTISQGISFI